MNIGRDLIYKITNGITGPWLVVLIAVVVLGMLAAPIVWNNFNPSKENTESTQIPTTTKASNTPMTAEPIQIATKPTETLDAPKKEVVETSPEREKSQIPDSDNEMLTSKFTLAEINWKNDIDTWKFHATSGKFIKITMLTKNDFNLNLELSFHNISQTPYETIKNDNEIQTIYKISRYGLYS